MHLPKNSISPLARLCYGNVEFTRDEIIGALSDVSIYPDAAELIYSQIIFGIGQLAQVSDNEQGIVDDQIEGIEGVLFSMENAKFTFLINKHGDQAAPVLDITSGDSRIMRVYFNLVESFPTKLGGDINYLLWTVEMVRLRDLTLLGPDVKAEDVDQFAHIEPIDFPGVDYIYCPEMYLDTADQTINDYRKGAALCSGELIDIYRALRIHEALQGDLVDRQAIMLYLSQVMHESDDNPLICRYELVHPAQEEDKAFVRLHVGHVRSILDTYLDRVTLVFGPHEAGATFPRLISGTLHTSPNNRTLVALNAVSLY